MTERFIIKKRPFKKLSLNTPEIQEVKEIEEVKEIKYESILDKAIKLNPNLKTLIDKFSLYQIN